MVYSLMGVIFGPSSKVSPPHVRVAGKRLGLKRGR